MDTEHHVKSLIDSAKLAADVNEHFSKECGCGSCESAIRAAYEIIRELVKDDDCAVTIQRIMFAGYNLSRSLNGMSMARIHQLEQSRENVEAVNDIIEGFDIAMSNVFDRDEEPARYADRLANLYMDAHHRKED